METTNLWSYSKKTRICQSEEDENIIPIAPHVHGWVGNLAAYHDTNGCVIYFNQFVGVLGQIVKLSTCKAANRFFKKFEFKTMSDQDSTQVENGLLSASNKCPKTTVIEWNHLSIPPKGGIVSTTMQWVNPKSVVIDASVINSTTLSVSDVVGALNKARELGCHMEDEPSYQNLPIYGDVLMGTAFLEKGHCPIQFRCFSNHKPYKN